MGVLAEPINALGEGFNNFVTGIGDFFGNLIESLGSWFEDVGSWFGDVIDDIESLGNDIGLWFQGIGDKITQFATNFSNTMSNIMSYLDPTSDNFFLKLAFIPSDGFITGKFDELKGVLDDRLPIIGTFTDLFTSITEVQSQSINSTSPTFTMELPSKWGGQTVQVINFAPIDPYVPYIKTLIRFFLWIPFIIKIYKRLPQVIY